MKDQPSEGANVLAKTLNDLFKYMPVAGDTEDRVIDAVKWMAAKLPVSYNWVDEKRDIIHAETTTAAEAMLIAGRGTKRKGYSLIIAGKLIGEITYLGVGIEGANVIFKFNFKPDQPVDFVTVSIIV